MSWKRWILGLPIVASGVLAGEACCRLTGFYPALLSDSRLIGGMLAWLLAALLATAVAGGITAAVLGAGPIGLLAVALAAVGLALTWGLNTLSALGAAAFLLLTAWSLFTIQSGLRARVRFSAAWLGRATAGLLTGLSLAAGAAVYSGAEQSVAEHGVMIPEQAWEIVSLTSENYIGLFVPEELRGPQMEQLNQAFQTHLRERVQDLAQPYRQYLPLIYAGLFILLVLESNRLVALLAALGLRAAIPLLQAAGLARYERSTVEVERLVPG